MHAPLTTSRQKYYYLMSLVCEDLIGTATPAINAMVRAGHEASASQLTAVRVGRSPHLPWLIDLVRASLPQFPIPEQVLPAAPVAAPAGLAMSLGL